MRKFVTFILGLIFRNKTLHFPVDSSKFKKILIYRADAIGDMLVTTPIIDLIHRNLPDAEIHFLCSKSNRLILKYNPNVEKCYVYDGKFRTMLRLIPKMRKAKYDCVLSFVIYKTTNYGTLINLLVGRKTIKIAMLHPGREKGYSAFFNVQIPVVREKEHIAEFQTRMVCEAFGWNFDKPSLRMEFPLSLTETNEVEEFCNERNLSKFVVFNISAKRSYNMFSAEKDSEFIRKFSQLYPDLPVVIIASPSEKNMADEMIDSYKNSVLTFSSDNPTTENRAHNNLFLFPPEKNLLIVSALIKRCLYLISPDTAIVHIAAAMNKPILAFYTRKTAFLDEWAPFRVPFKRIIAENDEPIESIPVEEAIFQFSELMKI